LNFSYCSWMAFTVCDLFGTIEGYRKVVAQP